MRSLPQGWTVELQGLSESVVFTSPAGSFLLWSPEGWMRGHGTTATPAPGLPQATSMKEARRIGTDFLAALTDS